jgi:hypothetical protein
MCVSGDAKTMHDDSPVKAQPVLRLLNGGLCSVNSSLRRAFSWRCLEAA